MGHPSELRDKIIAGCNSKFYALSNAERELEMAESFLFDAAANAATLELRLTIYKKRAKGAQFAGQEYVDKEKAMRPESKEVKHGLLKQHVAEKKAALEKAQEEFDKYFQPETFSGYLPTNQEGT